LNITTIIEDVRMEVEVNVQECPRTKGLKVLCGNAQQSYSYII
jgi:hypothetical protein